MQTGRYESCSVAGAKCEPGWDELCMRFAGMKRAGWRGRFVLFCGMRAGWRERITQYGGINRAVLQE